jgi:chemotaxis protein MotB
MSTSTQPIIIKKKKAHGHGHHSSAWKVAFADFMTAMMAFFLLMWLLGSTSEQEKHAISGYFNDPGGSMAGPGGANAGMIDFGTPLTTPQAEAVAAVMSTPAPTSGTAPAQSADELSDDVLAEAMQQREREQLEKLREELERLMAQDGSIFKQLSDQILIDYTKLGLRIQIVDKEHRSMFDLGSSHLKVYSEQVLKALAPLLDGVPNRISVTGHTDAVPFGAGAFYTNWELSSDRANTARRALLDGGYPEPKFLTAQGMGSAAPFKPEAPDDPSNRRIAILVLKQDVADAMLGHAALPSDQLLEAEENALKALGASLPQGTLPRDASSPGTLPPSTTTSAAPN